MFQITSLNKECACGECSNTDAIGFGFQHQINRSIMRASSFCHPFRQHDSKIAFGLYRQCIRLVRRCRILFAFVNTGIPPAALGAKHSQCRPVLDSHFVFFAKFHQTIFSSLIRNVQTDLKGRILRGLPQVQCVENGVISPVSSFCFHLEHHRARQCREIDDRTRAVEYSVE